MFFFTVIYFLL